MFVESKNMLKLTRRILTSTNSFDPIQLQQMKQHELLLVNTNDQITSTTNKWNAHQTKTASLHRAFSLFIFNHNKSKLLLQKRASEKITFPNLWTNSCCSHPRNVIDEINDVQGVILAAKRRCLYEMNIDLEGIENCEKQKIQFLTKILYEGASCENFVEKELDYWDF